MQQEIIFTEDAPRAIGTYSQAVKVGNTIYLSGQIPLIPETMELVKGDKTDQIKRVFMNLAAVAKASGGSLSNITKLNIYLTDLSDFPLINEIMPEYFSEPYPARAVVGVANLPKGATIEMDAIMMI
tara:strand:+ start:762 stop:1142 length:381 start_codon:yes stop_codon:yes gene_type:complete